MAGMAACIGGAGVFAVPQPLPLFFCCPGYYKNNGIRLYYNANKYIYQAIFTRNLNFFLAASLIKMTGKAKGRFTLTKSAFKGKI